jgi:hypothetical protein
MGLIIVCDTISSFVCKKSNSKILAREMKTIRVNLWLQVRAPLLSSFCQNEMYILQGNGYHNSSDIMMSLWIVLFSVISNTELYRCHARMGGRYRCADTSPTLTVCLWFLRTALRVVRGTQRIPNCTRWLLLSNWRVTLVLGLGVTGALRRQCDESIALCEVATPEYPPNELK